VQGGGTSSFIATCSGNGGGSVRFCTDTACSAGCRDVFVPGPGACLNTSPVLGSVPGQAQSFSLTCGTVQPSSQPQQQQQQPPQQGVTPSLLPSTSTTNGAGSSSVAAAGVATAGALAAAALFL
jgi:hypothetical protein